ncbi:hypothetical protein [Cohnella lupini]|uniref:Uncharacterized protein n=1 Tax=Cohnella lupini TaxID=1294267 RepID=A0A3D9I5H8_9BACL|nr:hypothetical protein [Cohnella lupini]RED56779.1 hypothetical protein DFP95_11270 [Cohnella lupini]
MKIQLTSYNGNIPRRTEEIQPGKSISFEGAEWKVALTENTVTHEGSEGPFFGKETTYVCRLLAGTAINCSFTVSLSQESWSEDNYVLIPGAAYNGNRFSARSMPYAPLLKDAKDIGVDVPTIISDVQRLNIAEGSSKLEQTTQDPSTPAVAYYSPSRQRAVLLFTEQKTIAGPTGLTIEENDSRSEADIRFTVPAVRLTYHAMVPELPLPENLLDVGKDWQAGDEVSLKLRCFELPCSSIRELFEHFAELRKTMTGLVPLVNSIPFSETWSIQESKYNALQWESERGYYSVGMRENPHQDWQPGWVGGAMSTLPLLFEGGELSQERALRTLDFLFSTQTSSGLFYGVMHQGKAYGDGFGNPNTEHWHLIRKTADVLYYLMKHFILLEKKGLASKIKTEWLSGTRKLADRFVALWNEYGQFGQFVDVHSGAIVVGGSTSASTAPAGLALAGKYFDHAAYLDTAKKSAEHYYERDVLSGITTGGPGEILQCPDSESAFGLLESFVVLYETTEERQWLDYARDMAKQCASWCVSYDFDWPEGSEFGRLDMRSAGSVIANVQNKHSAPGICTLSGDSLFKLYRATGDEFYLELIREIAHNLPQYLSRDDRPIVSWDDQILNPGVMCERVNMSDWEGKDKVGGVFNGTCWSEVSNMLTYVEIPGLYVLKNTGFLCAIDHIEAKVTSLEASSIEIEMRNPTRYAAKVKVLVETSEEAAESLGQMSLYGCPVVELAPGETRLVTF